MRSDVCHLENSELEPNFPKYKGRVVLRGDIVKDDSGSYAVFTEQGSSACKSKAQMTTLATEAAILFATRAVRSSMTDLSTTIALVCASTAPAASARTLATAARGT